MELEKEGASDEEDELLGSKTKKDQDGIWVMEKTDEEIVDFLSPTASKNVLSVNPEKKTFKRSRQHAFETNEEGKMVIEDLPERENVSKKKQKKDDERLVPDAMLGKEFVNRAASIIQRRREKREELLAKGKKTVQGGDRFKADKAGGDVKKGKLDPFAYVPLDPAQLNKRSRGSAHKRFEAVIRKPSKTPMSGGIKKSHGRMRSKMSKPSARR
jgi:ribosomal RNA-processing protein 12